MWTVQHAWRYVIEELLVTVGITQPAEWGVSLGEMVKANQRGDNQ